jgi:hypothetical protein
MAFILTFKYNNTHNFFFANTIYFTFYYLLFYFIAGFLITFRLTFL